jgi:hypothetical protein
MAKKPVGRKKNVAKKPAAKAGRGRKPAAKAKKAASSNE